MTEHVRTSYRSHRKATWALVLGLAGLVAAVVIPFATGAPDKTYTFQFPAAGAVTPALVSGSGNGTSKQTLCTGTDYTSVKLVINNTARTSTLGSGDVTLPDNVTLTGDPSIVDGNAASTATISRSGNVVSLRGLSLPARTGTVTFSLILSTGASAVEAQNITASVKQSNNFSDAGTNPTANAFDPPSAWPQIALADCNVEIGGRVYHDRNADSSFTIGSGAFINSDVPKAWTVNLFSKGTGDASYPTSPFRTATSASATGLYSFTGLPAGRDYKVCVVAAGADASAAWGLQAPTGNSACGSLSSTSGASSAGRLLPNLTASASNQDFAAVPATPLFGPGSESLLPGYEVIAGSNSTKPEDRYTHETWVDENGRTNFRFAPIVPVECSGSPPPPNLFLIETLTADVDVSTFQTSPPTQVVLRYDDCPPFADGDLQPMPYCSKDPMPANWPTDKTLATTGVLPGTHTSCIVRASQSVITGAKLRIQYVVYTAFDGGRQVG